MLKRKISAIVAVLGLPALAGCTVLEVAMAYRIRLDTMPVSELTATLSPSSSLAPGQSAQMIIVATANDGTHWTSQGAGHGNVVFDSFSFDPSIVTVGTDGVVTMPVDPRISDGQLPQVRITLAGHPDTVVDLAVPVHYNIAFAADFSGSDGRPGEDVHIWLTVQGGRYPLLQARLAGAGREQFFLIDPNGGSLTVDANGGNAGAAGHFVVSVDPQAEPLLNRLTLINRSGAGVLGPAPDIEVEPVAPLW